MRPFTHDHPLVRRSYVCPICASGKSMGSVWCASCQYDTQLVMSDKDRHATEDTLDLAELALSIEEQGLPPMLNVA